MSKEFFDVNRQYGIGHGSFKETLFAFLLSIFCILAAYFLVIKQPFTGFALAAAVTSLGILQAAVQLVVFFSLGRDEKPQWNTITFAFMAVIFVVIIIGSLWIMYNLDYRMMA